MLREVVRTQCSTMEPFEGLRLWVVDLDLYARKETLDGLSETELARAKKMVRARDSMRYLVSRHALRRILSTEIGHDQIHIETDEIGKPRLAADESPQFNLSHSENFALIGLCKWHAIGVDIEVIRPIGGADELVRSHFSGSEQLEWSRAPSQLRDHVFMTYWTRKEACLKALGVGLVAPLASIDTSESYKDGIVRIPLGGGHCDVNVYPVLISEDLIAAVALAKPIAVSLARNYFKKC